MEGDEVIWKEYGGGMDGGNNNWVIAMRSSFDEEGRSLYSVASSI